MRLSRWGVLAGLLLAAPPSHADTLFTKTRNGTISLNKNLTEHECEIALKMAKGEPVTPAQIEAAKAAREAKEKRAAEWGKLNSNHCIPSFDHTGSPCDLYMESIGPGGADDIVQAECLR